VTELMELSTTAVLTPDSQMGSGVVASGSECGEDVMEMEPLALEMKNILVPIDFSDGAKKALAYAIPLARQFNAKITLLHVSQVQFYANEFAHLPIDEAAMKECVRGRLEAMARGCIAPELLKETLVRHGVAFDEITKVARELCADMIVINTHGYTGLKHVVMGSTAERVVRYAGCPVLVVRDRECA